MKRVIFSIIALYMAIGLPAQNREPFCCVKQGAELKYQTTDAKGNETSTSVTKITDVSGFDGNYTLTQTITVFVNGTQMFQPMSVTTTITDGNASMALGGGMAVDITSDVPFIPSNLSVGQELSTGTMIINMNGIKTTQEISSHKVVGQEEINTPAGTFDCFVVEQEYVAKVAFMKVKGSQKIWYARGVGNVKTETYDKKGKISSRQILVSIM